jgi:choline monooxygenase
MAEPFQVGPEIERASTLPASFYSDVAVFERLRERVFAPAWHLAPPSAIPVETEGAQPFVLMPGVLDEPLLFTRDAGGEIHLLSNACTHRGALVAPQACRGRELRCPYHGRRFALDGRLRAAPGFEGAEDFPRPVDDLRNLPLHERGPLRFFSLRSAQPFAAWMEALDQRLGFLPLSQLRPDPTGERCFDVKANWALYVENYLEGFHVPFVHPTLARAIDLELYRVELLSQAVLQTAEARPGEPAFEPPAGHPDHGRRVAAYYLWLFPNLMLNFYPWGLSANVAEPRGPGTSAIRYHRYIWREDLLERGAGAGLDQVEHEDESVVESVQVGLRSRLWPGGRFSPAHEPGLHHFQRLLAAAANGDSACRP